MQKKVNVLLMDTILASWSPEQYWTRTEPQHTPSCFPFTPVINTRWILNLMETSSPDEFFNTDLGRGSGERNTNISDTREEMEPNTATLVTVCITLHLRVSVRIHTHVCKEKTRPLEVLSSFSNSERTKRQSVWNRQLWVFSPPTKQGKV